MNVISRTIKNDSKRHLTPASNSESGSGVTEGRRDKLTSQDGDDDANVPRLQTDEAGGEGGGRHVSEGGKGGSGRAGGHGGRTP